MANVDFASLAQRYRDELYGSVLPFWLEKSQDKQYGGYFTCLNRDGSVFDTDKFVWLQGREVWMFAMLYNKPRSGSAARSARRTSGICRAGRGS